MFETATAAIQVLPFAFFGVIVAELVRRRDARRARCAATERLPANVPQRRGACLQPHEGCSPVTPRVRVRRVRHAGHDRRPPPGTRSPPPHAERRPVGPRATQARGSRSSGDLSGAGCHGSAHRAWRSTSTPSSRNGRPDGLISASAMVSRRSPNGLDSVRSSRVRTMAETSASPPSYRVDRELDLDRVARCRTGVVDDGLNAVYYARLASLVAITSSMRRSRSRSESLRPASASIRSRASRRTSALGIR